MSTINRRPLVAGLVTGCVCGLVLALTIGSAPALASSGLAGKVAKALKLAKKANKNASAALAAAKVPGPPGPAGPSNGYASANTFSPVGWVASANQVLVTVPVTAGSSYLVTATVVANNNDALLLTTACFLKLPGMNLAQASFDLGPNGSDDDEVVTLTGGGTASTSGTAQLSCLPQSSNGTWKDARITAIKVGSLN